MHEIYAVSLAFMVAQPFCRPQCKHTFMFGFNLILLTAVQTDGSCLVLISFC